MAKEKIRKNKKNKPTMAEKADRHVLYEKAVQCVETEIDFIDQTYHDLRGRHATRLREDFCGTTNTSCEWIRRRQDNMAYCIDIDPAVLEWGRRHHVDKLKKQQAQRMHLVNDDVLKASTPAIDIVIAMNFSYWYIKTRKAMKQYFKKIYNALAEDGILFLDAFGGYEAFREMKENTKYKRFTYVWDQASYNPITGDALMHIHFKFKDGSRIKKAFTYDWRQWTLPELSEMLVETGFKPTIYWEGEDEDGEANGEFSPATEAPADAGWVAYIVAEKKPKGR